MLGGCIKLYTAVEAFIIELALAVIHSAAHGCCSICLNCSVVEVLVSKRRGGGGGGGG